MSEDTHFGYQRVSGAAKTAKVRDVFDSVASRYDLMNDLMSGGLHRIWKRFAISSLDVRPGQRIVDLAGGTGDLTRLIAAQTKGEGELFLVDINAQMLRHGRDRMLDAGQVNVAQLVQANAESLPFADNSVDRLIIGFGLRNVTRKGVALAEMSRVLVPGGRAVVLEFSQVKAPLLARIYDHYSFRVLPRLGERVAGDAESYQYLAESIRMHPDQESLTYMMNKAGFSRVRVNNLAGGIVAVHVGFKP